MRDSPFRVEPVSGTDDRVAPSVDPRPIAAITRSG
jgi:hypothetical protein